MYWEISPYENPDVDYCVMPADKQEDHKAALQYAKDRLEQVFDQCEEGQTITVTMTLCKGDISGVDIADSGRED